MKKFMWSAMNKAVLLCIIVPSFAAALGYIKIETIIGNADDQIIAVSKWWRKKSTNHEIERHRTTSASINLTQIDDAISRAQKSGCSSEDLATLQGARNRMVELNKEALGASNSRLKELLEKRLKDQIQELQQIRSEAAKAEMNTLNELITTKINLITLNQ